MSIITINLHNAVKSLKEAGISDAQAEKIVEVIADLQHSGSATKDDIKSATEVIKADIATIKTDLDWIKKLMLAIGVAVVIAALKYIFMG